MPFTVVVPADWMYWPVHIYRLPPAATVTIPLLLKDTGGGTGCSVFPTVKPPAMTLIVPELVTSPLVLPINTDSTFKVPWLTSGAVTWLPFRLRVTPSGIVNGLGPAIGVVQERVAPSSGIKVPPLRNRPLPNLDSPVPIVSEPEVIVIFPTRASKL